MRINKRLLISLTVATMLCAAALLRIGLDWPAPRVPSFDHIRGSHRGSDAQLLDRNHAVIGQLRIDSHGRRLAWASLADVSPAVRWAVVRAEDRRFWQHAGVDWRALAAGPLDGLRFGKMRGASTITMQLAALIEASPARRSVRQKWTQMRRARAIERNWSKSEILEAYLNLATFRGELQGIGSASRGLFGKDPHGLSGAESSILVALLRAPNASLDLVARRAERLAGDSGLTIGSADMRSRVRRALSASYFIQPASDLAPHVAEQLLGPLRTAQASQSTTTVVSTLDGALQSFVAETLRHHLSEIAHKNVRDGAVLVVDNRSGDVLAYVGNTGAGSSARYVDGIQARRQAGSTLKPFLYALGFDRRLLTPASLIEDSPLDIPVSGGVYRPRNYDNKFTGPVTVRTALASSLNVPAVRTLTFVGIESFLEKLQELGFQNLRTADYYGPALALGSTDIRLWDLVNAYRTLANGGQQGPLRLAPDRDLSLSSRRIYSEQAAFLVSDILSDRESRSRTFGLESPLSSRFWTAVKTGTSKEMRDNWCVGYSSRYTVGVWVGNFSGEPMWNVTGISGAGPVWIEVMNHLHGQLPSHPAAAPAGLVARNVDFPELGQARTEWFIEGTEPAVVQLASKSADATIAYPTEGTIVALDPDIPDDEQRLFFQSRPSDDKLNWVLDGVTIGTAGSIQIWKPLTGKHILLLVDSQQKTLDSVTFEVRGRPSGQAAVGSRQWHRPPGGVPSSGK